MSPAKAKRAKPTFTMAKTTNLTRLRDMGKTTQDIADAIGVTSQTVSEAQRIGEWRMVYEVACECLIRRFGAQGTATNTFAVTIPVGLAQQFIFTVEKMFDTKPVKIQ